MIAYWFHVFYGLPDINRAIKRLGMRWGWYSTHGKERGHLGDLDSDGKTLRRTLMKQCTRVWQNYPVREESIGRLRVPKARWEIHDQAYPPPLF